MPRTLDRLRDGDVLHALPDTARARARPVVLGTLSVRVEPSAERMALESAVHASAPLIIANMITLPAYPTTLILARQYATLPHEEDLDAVRATAERAAQLGIKTELLRISSPRPIAALLELVRERGAGTARVRSGPAADLSAPVSDRGAPRSQGCALPGLDRPRRVSRAGPSSAAMSLTSAALLLRRCGHRRSKPVEPHRLDEFVRLAE